MKAIKFSCLMLAVAFLAASCSKSDTSATTGWNYNDPEWGGFEVADVPEQPDAPGLLFIEGGSFVMGRVADDSRFQWNNVGHTVTVSSFYMDEAEVTNVAYREFVYWMERAYKEEFKTKYESILPDPNCWRDKLAWREMAVDYYFESPVYNDYPVVGVTWEQASKYCKWRTDRVNERILVEKGIITLNVGEDFSGSAAFQTDVYLAGAMEESEGGQKLPDLRPGGGEEGRNVRKSDGILVPSYRLPTEAEWEFAALGMIGNTVDERIVEHKTYPWAGQSVRSANKDYYGQFLANFKRSRGDAMGVAGNLNDAWDYTAPVKWYFPNDYGLYHMAGNVSEWVMDVYRKDVNPVGGEDVDPYRGNVYTELVFDEEGQALRNEEDGGDLTYKPIEDDMNRRNYRIADNINYLDGDKTSTIYNYSDNSLTDQWVEDETTGGEGEEEEEAEEEEETRSGVDESDQSAMTNMMYRRSTSKKSEVTSLINNKVRVVKGGSWNDRAYWMQAGTRRYYDQDKSTSWIGFRCAMDRLGSRTRE